MNLAALCEASSITSRRKLPAVVAAALAIAPVVFGQNSIQPTEIVVVLLKHRAGPNERGEGGSTPLMATPDGAAVDVLVAGGADLHATDDRGNRVMYSGWGASIPSRVEALRRHGLKLDPVKAARCRFTQSYCERISRP